jgi:hypothetical protein
MRCRSVSDLWRRMQCAALRDGHLRVRFAPFDRQSTVSVCVCSERRAVLRKQWQFSSICQFLTLFKSYLQLPHFTCSELESALVYPEDNSSFLADVMWKLLLTRKPEQPKKVVKTHKA